MNAAVTRSLVLGDDDHFASLQEQWAHHVRRRYHQGPDAQQHLLDVVAAGAPATVLEVDAGSGEFAVRTAHRTDARVAVTDGSPLLALQAAMRRIDVVIAGAGALPMASRCFDTVVVRRPRWSPEVTTTALGEVARVLDDHGSLLALAPSVQHDGHELDALVGCTLRRATIGLTADDGEQVLGAHFGRVERTRLDYVLTFPSGHDLASYLMAIPDRCHLAERVRAIAGPLRLSYGLSLFAASGPRR